MSRDCLVSDYREIVRNKDIDAVIIASPNVFHAEQALDAMAAGKHVFCEKPNSTSLEDHKKMVKFDHDHQELVTMTNYTLFFNPMEQKVKSMQANHASIEKASKGQEIGLKVKSKVRHGDKVYKI